MSIPDGLPFCATGATTALSRNRRRHWRSEIFAGLAREATFRYPAQHTRGNDDLSLVPQCELFSLAPRRNIRFSIQSHGFAALAMPRLRPALSRLAGGRQSGTLRALSPLRKF